MNQPVFPSSFFNHCPKVIEAKAWHRHLNVEPVDIESYADCAFINAGNGKLCENCNKFLTRPFLNLKVDEEFLPLIEEYYRKLNEYDKWQQEQLSQFVDHGSGI